jgi:hypothetical protein
MSTVETKQCSTCCTFKPLSSFYKNSKGAFGKSQKCSDCSKEYAREYRKNHRERWLAAKYDTGEDVIKVVESIEACEICGGTSKLCIDHCHETGAIRGRLCGTCNSGLGLLRDDVDTLKAAIEYLRKEPEYGCS